MLAKGHFSVETSPRPTTKAPPTASPHTTKYVLDKIVYPDIKDNALPTGKSAGGCFHTMHMKMASNPIAIARAVLYCHIYDSLQKDTMQYISEYGTDTAD